MKGIGRGIFSIIWLWVCVTSLVCWVKNPELSQMGVLLRTPYSIVLEFEIEGDF